MPFAILSIFVLAWGLPSIKTAMGKATTPAFDKGGWEVPYLHKAVSRAQPVVAKPTPENAKFDFNWLTAVGTGCFLSALLAGAVLVVWSQRIRPIFGGILFSLRPCLVALGSQPARGLVLADSGP